MEPNTKSLGELNREYFNSEFSGYSDIPWINALIQQISTSLRDNAEWIGLTKPSASDSPAPEVRMLDYACGNGTASSALAPFVSALRGIDISDGMVSAYNAAAAARGLSQAQMHAVCGDLLAEPTAADDLTGPDLTGFDVVVVCMALHHVRDAAELVRRLAARLRPGGSLVVVDWVLPPPRADEGVGGGPGARGVLDKLPGGHTCARPGFEERELVGLFAGAGLVDHAWLLADRPSEVPEEMSAAGLSRFFLARAQSPGEST